MRPLLERGVAAGELILSGHELLSLQEYRAQKLQQYCSGLECALLCVLRAFTRIEILLFVGSR